jgi:CubicO group peptidase (beta-lactamase class C family)
MTSRQQFRRAIFVTLAFLTAPLLAGAQPAPRKAVQAPPELDASVARVMKTFEVPGVSLAIVKDGRVVIAKGFGVRRLGEPAPVDSQTLFGIASNTKVFTATALGLLVEEGKIAWDAPVIEYLPWFQMWDPFVTRELTVRDLLLWWPASTYKRTEVLRRLRFIKPATSFRSSYAYDNVLYLAAGQLIEEVSRLTWEDFVAQRILKKVGMTTSEVRYSAASNRGNVAGTHAKVGGGLRLVQPMESDNTNPAGGINSNADDMAKWMLVLLNEGRLADGTWLYSEKTYRELTTMVTPIPIPAVPPELAALKPNFQGYALGLNALDYKGKKVLTHTGGLPGYLSKVTLLPELGLGITVLTNQESGEAFSSLTWQIVDYYLGAPATDWVDAYLKVRERQEARTAEALNKAAEARDAASKPSLGLEEYAGTYADAWYGDIEIAKEDGKLVLSFTKTPVLIGDLEHWQHDTFIVKWRDRELRADAYITFALNPDGTIDQAKMKAVSPETDFSFDFHDLLLKPAKKTKESRP